MPKNHPIKRKYRKVNKKTGRIIDGPIDKSTAQGPVDIERLSKTKYYLDEAKQVFLTLGPEIVADYNAYEAALKKDQAKIKEIKNVK